MFIPVQFVEQKSAGRALDQAEGDHPGDRLQSHRR